MKRENKAKILIVDDEPHICELLSRYLTSDGYKCTSVPDAESALQVLSREEFHLMITDIIMPGMSGMDLLTVVRKEYPDVAVIMVTAVDDEKTGVLALELGAYGYVIKPFEKNEVLISVANALDRRSAALLSSQYDRNLTQQAQQKIADTHHELEKILLRIIAANGAFHGETASHIRRVGLLASALAEEVVTGWTLRQMQDIRMAAAIHDIGKIGIPDHILSKPSKLTPEEFEYVKLHCEIGGQILHDTKSNLLTMAREIVLYHHEKWDGSGYPRALSGHDIPESARIVAICDVYDALLSKRSYRSPFSEDQALSIMEAGKNRHFDPTFLEAFIDLLPRLRHIWVEYPETD